MELDKLLQHLNIEVPKTTQFLFLVYPFHTLATNRILNTVISRKPKTSLLSDFKDMQRIGGFKVLYAGFVPCMMFLLAGQKILELKVHEHTVDYVQIEVSFSHSLFYSMMHLFCFYSLFNIQIIRMQCIDYPFRNKLLLSMRDMVRQDRLWMFVRGMPAIFMG